MHSILNYNIDHFHGRSLSKNSDNNNNNNNNNNNDDDDDDDNNNDDNNNKSFIYTEKKSRSANSI